MRFPKPDEWVKLVDEYKQSGLQQKEFCAKHDLPLSTLQYWLYRRAKRVRTDSNSSPNRVQRFLPVQVVASPAPKARDGVIEAALRSGVVLRFAIGTDTRYLAELFAALG